jgi:hypothetical protein
VTLLAFGLFVVAVAVMVLVHRKTQQLLEAQNAAAQKHLAESMEALLLARQKSMEKQGRALVREHERTRRAFTGRSRPC